MAKTRHMRKVEQEAKRSWYRFPAEIRDMVLSEIVAEANATLKLARTSFSVVPDQSIGYLASVCQDWQAFFERHIFKRLLLKDSSLSRFEQVILSRPTRLAYIKNILLRIELPEYDCMMCEQPEDQFTIQQNNTIFSSCIERLLKILASWNPEFHNSATPSSQGLTLEIFPCSPSDNNHRFHFCALEEGYPFQFEEDLSKTPSLLEYHQQRAAQGLTPQQKKHQTGTVFLARDAKRLYGTPLKLVPTVSILPRAPIVKGLLLRRSTCRSVDIGSLAQILRQSLIALTWFRFESRRAICYPDQRAFEKGYHETLIPALPSFLRRLYLNEDLSFSRDKNLWLFSPDKTALTLAICNSPALQQLSEFSAGYHVCAREFLIELGRRQARLNKNTIPLPRWENLELLCLSSATFASPTAAILSVQCLIYYAARAALNLPKLRIMEVWGSGSRGVAHLFRYKFEYRKATITWTCCEGRNVEIPRETIKLWRKVAIARGGRPPLKVIRNHFPESTAEIRDSQGQCIHKYLKLKRLYLDPITLAQIEADEVIRAGSQNQP